MKFFKELFSRDKNKQNQETKNLRQRRNPDTDSHLNNLENDTYLKATLTQAASETVAHLHAFLNNQENYSAQGFDDYLTRIFSAYTHELSSTNIGMLADTYLSTHQVVNTTSPKKTDPMQITLLDQQVPKEQLAEAARTLELMIQYIEKSYELANIFPTGIHTMFELDVANPTILFQSFSGIDFYQEDPKNITVPKIITVSLLFFDANLTHSWQTELYRRGAEQVAIKVDGSIVVTDKAGHKTQYRRFVTMEKSQVPSLLQFGQEPSEDDSYIVFIAHESKLPDTRQQRRSRAEQPVEYEQQELIPNKKRT